MRLLPLLMLAGCWSHDARNWSDSSCDVDHDDDGYFCDVDCDDENEAVHPDAKEVCGDGVDNDCDGSQGDDDNDGDGFVCADDCSDTNADVNPNAPEICDGLDNDCDEATDETGSVTQLSNGEWSDVTDQYSIDPNSPHVVSINDSDLEVHFCDGTWYGVIIIAGSGVSIVGHDATLDGAAADRVIYNTGEGVIVRDLTLTNGAFPDGANVACFGGSLDLVRCDIHSGVATNAGGGVASAGACRMLISATDVHDNIAPNGAGILVNGGSAVVDFTTGSIYANESPDAGTSAFVGVLTTGSFTCGVSGGNGAAMIDNHHVGVHVASGGTADFNDCDLGTATGIDLYVGDSATFRTYDQDGVTTGDCDSVSCSFR